MLLGSRLSTCSHGIGDFVYMHLCHGIVECVIPWPSLGRHLLAIASRQAQGVTAAQLFNDVSAALLVQAQVGVLGFFVNLGAADGIWSYECSDRGGSGRAHGYGSRRPSEAT